MYHFTLSVEKHFCVCDTEGYISVSMRDKPHILGFLFPYSYHKIVNHFTEFSGKSKLFSKVQNQCQVMICYNIYFLIVSLISSSVCSLLFIFENGICNDYMIIGIRICGMYVYTYLSYKNKI